MKKIKNMADFDSKFLTVEDGSVYVRFDFGGFYEWYKRTDTCLSLVDLAISDELEKSLETFESLQKRKVIFLGDIRPKSETTSAASEK